jgi:gliding motility-associated-like protein
MVRHLIVVFLFLLTNFSFSQRTVVLTQNQSNAEKGIDRKAWNGMGNISGHSDGYANDFTLPTRMNPCEKITNVKVNINITNYNKTSGCPHNNTYFNLLYGCSTYSGGATCPTSNVIYENSYSVNPPGTTLNFNTSDPRYKKLDFGGNLSVDIIPVSTPGCNPVTNGGLTYEYTTTVTVTIAEDLPTTPAFTQVAPICSGGSLSALPTTSINNIIGIWSPALNNLATTTYTFTPAVGQCATSTTMTITVNPKTSPNFNPVAAVCSGATIAALPTSSNNGIPGTWAPALDNLATTNYTFTPAAGQCANNASLTINVIPKTIPNFNPVAAVCSGATIAALPTSSLNGIPGTWAPALNNLATTAYTFTPAAGQCATSTTMTITVNPDPFLKPTLKDGKICIEKATGNTLKPYRIETNLNNPNFEFEWYFENVKINGATQNWYEASAIGNYSVLVYNKLTGCTSIEAFATMTETFPANSYTIEQTAAFTDNSAITITVNGSINDYRYKIDNGPWQNSNVFLGVSSGLHTIHITDIEGCTSFTDTVTIINYPKCFTPNGDGFNDTWNVIGFGINSNAKLSIFDQYGKLIKQISSDETGWDGTFNNQMLPATDYWFTIQYSENMIEKLFKAHFSLKR